MRPGPCHLDARGAEESVSGWQDLRSGDFFTKLLVRIQQETMKAWPGVVVLLKDGDRVEKYLGDDIGVMRMCFCQADNCTRSQR